MLYNGVIHLGSSTVVKARALVDGQWTALNEASFDLSRPPLRVTEIMYHPAELPANSVFNGDDDYEFVEVTNTSDVPVNLEDIAFTEGIRFAFPAMKLGPGDRVLVVRDQAAFQQRYGRDLNVAGQYGDTPQDYKLSNAGESLSLVDNLGNAIQRFTFDDQWFPETDGEGKSLELVDPTNSYLASWNQKASWRASPQMGGSPGRVRTNGDFNQDQVVDAFDKICFTVTLEQILLTRGLT